MHFPGEGKPPKRLDHSGGVTKPAVQLGRETVLIEKGKEEILPVTFMPGENYRVRMRQAIVPQLRVDIIVRGLSAKCCVWGSARALKR